MYVKIILFTAEAWRLRWNAQKCSREGQSHVQGAAAARAQEGWEELLHVQGQEGRCEEIPLVQGKEQWLHFAGAAMKR